MVRPPGCRPGTRRLTVGDKNVRRFRTGIGMAAASVDDLKARIAQLEHQIAELTQRLSLLERSTRPRDENPVDQKTVREKVVYDWQS